MIRFLIGSYVNSTPIYLFNFSKSDLEKSFQPEFRCAELRNNCEQGSN